MVSTSTGFVFDIRLFAWRMVTARKIFPLVSFALEAFRSPPALVLFLFGREDSRVTAVTFGVSCIAAGALFFLLRGRFIGF